MKQKLILLLTAFLLLTGMNLWGQFRTEASIDFSEQGYENAQDMDGVIINIDDNVTVVFNKASGSNSPKYYNTGTAIRAYGGNNFVISSTGTISSITLTFGSSDGSNEIITEVGTFVSPTWTGESNEVTFTIGGTSGHRRIKAIDVIYSDGGGQQQETVSTPTFSPEGGTYYETQSVSLSCATEGATILYTLDGTTPNENSIVYSGPITITETTTVKAFAMKEGYLNSGVASATYTIAEAPSVITIAEARALANNEYALVQGIVTFIDNRNVYIQDETAGIDLYLNNNTVPSTLTLGDLVQAYGKRAAYNGLVELSGIDGNDAEQFSILSSGNTLPLVVKTIAEILEGGADALQCTRVKVESATIGAINTSSNTPLTQDGSSINIYKVPALTDIEEGDVVDVVAVVGYFNTPQLRVASADDVILSETPVLPDPQLTVSPTQLIGFQYTYGAGPSEPMTLTVSGSNLTSTITLSASEHFELSINPENGYSDSDELSPVNGTLTETTIYVRMKSGLEANNYTGNLTIVSGDLSYSVALSGQVTELLVAATPTFNPEGGTYYEAQSVSISCATEGATIYYSMVSENGPWTVYQSAISINESMTIWAYAEKEGYLDSSVASATYVIAETPSVITIAEARALELNEYALVQGIVTFIDNRNVYIQDETAGIDLFLNNNTVPSALALGDLVQAYGKRAAYNGLVELSGIDGNDAEQFSILSSGNTLPLVVKTIAEILEGGADALQCTRVKVESATIGAINTSGNTPLTQDGSSINIYKVPALTNIEEGDVVDVIAVVGYFNAPQLRVASADDVILIETPVITDPQLTVSVSGLSGFSYVYGAGPSAIQYFEIGGENLTHNVIVSPSENFEISSLSGDLFQPENPVLIYIPESGSLSNFQIYVRLKADLEVGTYNEQIAVTSEGADTIYVNVTGTVTGEGPTPPPTPSGNYVRINELGQLVEGSYVVFAARFDENATDYYAMSNTSSGKPVGVLFTSATADENEILPASIVDEESNYYWTVGITDNGYTFTNAANELIGYGESGTDFVTGGEKTGWNIVIGTAGESAMVPGHIGFYITNTINTGRGFALNSQHNYGAYAVSNNNSSSYNFYLDLFVKTEGGVPPTPTVATPTFSPAAGTYFETQTVSIACATDGATIYYTLDGTDPTENSQVYSTPLTIEATTTVKAIAMKEGYNNSNIAEATYTIQLGVVTIFNQDWEGEMNGWTFVDVAGDASWNVASYSGNHYAYANGYNHGANEDWCISPAFNLNAYSNPVLSFRTAKNYTGNDLEVYFSNNYDGENPTNATWIQLTCALSPGSWTWTESGDIDLSSFSGSNCYIGFKYTCEEGNAAGWEVDDILLVGSTSDPVVTVLPLALTGFTYIEGNGPSTEQSFTVSGFNLSDNITITDAPDFEISQYSGDDFVAQNPIILEPVNGNVEETTIHVRLKAGLEVGNYNEEVISITSEVDDYEVACSGTVTAQPVPGDDYVRIVDVSQLVAGNRVVFAARFDENASDYYAMSNAASGHPTGVLFTSTFSGNDEILPSSILAEEDDFYWTVNVTADGYTFTNAAGEMVGYTSGTNFAPNGDNTEWSIETGTSEETAMVPNYTGFVISNVNNPVRAFALNSSHNFGPYHTQNMTSENYNFFLDIFMQGEGGVPPTPTVATPTFSPAGGTYYEAQTVTISCATDDATIHYTLDGTDPNLDSPIYTGPLAIDTTTTVKAYAVKTGYDDSPIVSAEYIIHDDIVIIFNQDWEDDWNGWTEVCQEGDSLWHIASYQGNHYAYANGYNHDPSTDWLISPAFNLDSYNDVVLTFRTATNYTGPILKVFFSNEYDGQNLNPDQWQELECELSQGSWNWVESGEISLDEFSGSNCYVAFRYTSNEDAAAWEVDDIMLTSGGSVAPTPTLTATPNIINSGLDYVEGQGPSLSRNYTLTGANLEGSGYIELSVNEYFEILQEDGTYGPTLQIPYENGQLEGYTVSVRMVEGLEVGYYEDTIIHQGGGAYTEVSLSGTVISENEPYMMAFMPYYIQGNNGSNNNRVPVATAVYLYNLEPNTTYRYTNQFVDGNDGPETAGAGNVIYAYMGGFYRTTSPSLATEGDYGEFMTDEDGAGFVWFMNEPTANARFTPGNHVYLRIRLNDGHDGTTVEQTFTSGDYATVLNFGTEHDAYNGSAFYVKSNENPMSFAMLMPNGEDVRPLYSTSIETTGIDYGSINQYADFYKDLVAGQNGWFGGILPNDCESGVNVIFILNIQGYLQNAFFAEDGQWYPEANTINPTNGLDEPIFIDLTEEGVEEDITANIKVWSADHEFVIENGDNSHYTMTVYNVLGQPMLQQQINAGCTERIGHSLASGVYIISLQNNQNKVAVKVIVR